MTDLATLRNAIKLATGRDRPIMEWAEKRIAELEAERAWRSTNNCPIGYSHPYSTRPDAAEFILIWNGRHQGIGYGQVDENDKVEWWGEDGCPIEPLPTHWRPLCPPPDAADD